MIILNLLFSPYIYLAAKLFTIMTIIQINTNGIISMDAPFTQTSGQLYLRDSLYLVAPFWDDINIALEGGVGSISYQVYSTGSSFLDTVNTIISGEENINFRGHWMLVVEWDSVPAYGGSPNQVIVQ